MSFYGSRRTSASTSPAPSPTTQHTSQLPSTLLPVPSGNALAGGSSVSLNREGSSSSQRSGRSGVRGMIPSPRGTMPPPPPSQYQHQAASGSGQSSASGSRSGSVKSTPRILSRRSSTKEGVRPAGLLIRKGSDRTKGKGREEDYPHSAAGALEGWRSPVIEADNIEVIETPQMTATRDPETGRKMINQYLVLHEIGHGAHGQVRLGRDMSVEVPIGETDEDGQGHLSINALYAIKMVDRMPKRKKLQTLRRGYGRTDGGKMVGESEIRKEVAIFKKVHHPNVVRLKEIIDDPEQSKIFMVLEYCEGGEIRWKDEDGGPALTVTETRRIFRDTLLGLEYLHHQGIIHRDIKPSNLLLSGDGLVKISDFGCSHYSEALRAASAQPGPDGDRYVDDVELAKTAGSPAFFAPEMCYSGLDDDVPTRESLSPLGTPVNELPGFTLRPPSIASEFGETRPSRSDPLVMSPGGRTIPLKQTISNDSATLARRPLSVRSHSSHTIAKKEPRTPITNAIDVWALGVTLYCLLFGRTPFDAANEYLLMQVIPTQDFAVPAYMGKERILATSAEFKEALDLLRKLLEKNPTKRITLEQAKRHPFTLRGLSDPTTWLASTDPHARDFVTVSNDEVLAAVTTSTSFRDKFKKGMKSIGHKLQMFSGSRHRGRSITDLDRPASASTSAEGSTVPSYAGSQINLTAADLFPLQSPQPSARLKTRMPSVSRDASPLTSPQGTVSRRFSMLGSRLAGEPAPAPRRQTVQLNAKHESVLSPVQTHVFEGLDRTPSQGGGFVVHRSQSQAPSHLVPPSTANLTVASDVPRSPTKVASTASLDKYRKVPTISPPGSIRRRMSDVDVTGRQRAPSNASSAQASVSGFGKLVKMLSRNSSSRSGSRFGRRGRAEQSVGSDDVDDHAISESSPVEALRRISLDEERISRSVSRASHDRETLNSDVDISSSYSSRIGPQSFSSPGQSYDSRGGPAQWTSRLPLMSAMPTVVPPGLEAFRRNSSPHTAVSALSRSEFGTGESEDGPEEVEPVDWDGEIPDDDDDDEYDETPHLSSGGFRGSTLFGGNFTSPFDASPPERESQIGLIARQLQENAATSTSAHKLGPLAIPHPATAGVPTLEAIPDASPPESSLFERSPFSSSPASILAHPQPVSPNSSIRPGLPRHSTSPTQSTGVFDGGWNGKTTAAGETSPGNAHRSTSRTSSRASGSPYRVGMGYDRTRSPLGRVSDDEDQPREHLASTASPAREMIKLEHSPLSSQQAQHHHLQHHVAQLSHNGSPHRASSTLARQSSSGSGFGSIRTGPVTPGSGSHSHGSASGMISPLEMPPHGNYMPLAPNAMANAIDLDEEEGLAIDFGSKRGRKGSVLGKKADFGPPTGA